MFHFPAELVYGDAGPFPHAVIDGVLPLDTAIEAAHEVTTVSDKLWQHDEHEHQQGKTWVNHIIALPPVLRAVLLSGNRPEFVRHIAKLTGIDGLRADPFFAGGGLHRTAPGGHLDVHADFMWNTQLELYRRVNLLLYLNEQWRPGDGGELELWDADMLSADVIVEPVFNRAVLFTTDAQSYHGHPSPVNGKPRYSLAWYYYTKEPPERFERTTRAQWQRRGPK